MRLPPFLCEGTRRLLLSRRHYHQHGQNQPRVVVFVVVEIGITIYTSKIIKKW